MIRDPELGLSAGARRRVGAIAGIVGPAAFIGSWMLGGVLAGADYSPVEDPISRLAAVDAETRTLMTTGLVVFGLAMPLYAVALRSVAARGAAIAAAGTGLATLAVAALPLDRSPAIDRWHGVAAGIGYLALAVTPLFAAGPLRRRGWRRLANAGVVAGVSTLVALGLTVSPLPTGLMQRLGLTVTDVWIVATAVSMLGATGQVRRDAQRPYGSESASASRSPRPTT